MNRFMFGLMLFLLIVLFIPLLLILPVWGLVVMILLAVGFLFYLVLKGNKLDKKGCRLLNIGMIIVIIFHFLDLLSTVIFVNIYGIEREANALMRFFLNTFGGWGYVVGFLLPVILYWFMLLAVMKVKKKVFLPVVFVFSLIKVLVISINILSL